MTKDEFLMNRTQDVINIFEESESYSPTFAVLFADGNTTSVATSFYGMAQLHILLKLKVR